ncbi:MAG: NAD(P)H-hydrate dehydratase [Erythrobacter sp.]
MNHHQVLTVAQMRAAEQAIFDAGTSVDELMAIAGRGAAEWIRRVAAGRTITVLCGPGNNGGDGYMIAETLRQSGHDVSVIAPMPPTTDAARNARNAFKGKLWTSGSTMRRGVFVDCLFGSGLSRPLSAELEVLLMDLAKQHESKVAVDLPSGVNGDSGTLAHGRIVSYDLTLALGAWKFAHWEFPAKSKMGTTKLVPIGIAGVADAAQVLGKPQIDAPATDTHKYRRGLCAIVAGAMPGATMLASEAAMRAGAGYVKLLSNASSAVPNGLVIEGGSLPNVLSDDRINAVLIGPGLGRDSKAIARLNESLSEKDRWVIDADALHLLKPGMLCEDGQVLLTPHDGELEELCKSFAVVAEGRKSRAQALARASGMTVLAKGPNTIIAAPDGRVTLAPPASSWLSAAGTGDVLAGIAVSRLATGRDPFDAACEAVWLHGEAAWLCGAAFTADELAHMVGNAMKTAS